MEILENVIWNYLTIPLLFTISLFFTVKLKAPQLNLKKMFGALLKKTDKESLSPVATLFVALSARVGVGTLAGTGLAIAVGGLGAIFWMWVSATITAAATFAENTLAQTFKRHKNDETYGGPAFYIQYGLKRKKLAALYAIILIITYSLGFVAVQMNTLTVVLHTHTALPPMIIGLLLVGITVLTIGGSIKKISGFIAKIIPFIALAFFTMALMTLIGAFNQIPLFFTTILTQAFGAGELIGGGIGIALTTGIKRGIFSNEAGLGTGAHAAALTEHEDPKEQGYIGVLGIYLTTLVSITLVAFMIFSAEAHTAVTLKGNGIEFLTYAMHHHFGITARAILPLTIFFFGFSTVITAYLYGLMNIKFLTTNPIATTAFKSVLLIIIFLAANTAATTIWRLVDTGVAITAIINLTAIFLLRHHIK